MDGVTLMRVLEVLQYLQYILFGKGLEDLELLVGVAVDGAGWGDRYMMSLRMVSARTYFSLLSILGLLQYIIKADNRGIGSGI